MAPTQQDRTASACQEDLGPCKTIRGATGNAGNWRNRFVNIPSRREVQSCDTHGTERWDTGGERQGDRHHIRL